MARILIRPDELGRLARRFDAAADDLGRAGRRLARTRADVRFNPEDEAFPTARVVQRAALVEADLRRLAAGLRVDSALMARTVDDAELEGDARWTPGLLNSGAATAPAKAPAVGSLASVAAGLLTVGARRSAAGAATSTGNGAIGPGGLFAATSIAGDHELLVRLTERLEAAAGSHAVAHSGGVAAEAVWSQIAGELFGAGGDP